MDTPQAPGTELVGEALRLKLLDTDTDGLAEYESGLSDDVGV